LADKQAAKLRRRDNREQREREKGTRTGDSPAQKAEQTRRRNEAFADRDLKNRGGAATPLEVRLLSRLWTVRCAVQHHLPQNLGGLAVPGRRPGRLQPPDHVSWSMADHMRAELVTDALQMALAQRRPALGLI
jgi:hypothetical protein